MTISSGPGQGHCRYILPLSKTLIIKIEERLLHCFSVRVRSGRKRVLHHKDLLRLVSCKIFKLATYSDHFEIGQSCEPGAGLYISFIHYMLPRYDFRPPV